MCENNQEMDFVQWNRYELCVCMRERERVRETRSKTGHCTRWEEGALYSHPLSSLTTRLMEHGEGFRLISYVS